MSGKTYFFNAGLPRSGNTVLSCLLNQNPSIRSSANSFLCDHLYNTALLSRSEKFSNFPDSSSLESLLRGSFDSYYSEWDYPYIIDRAPWGTPTNLELLKLVFGENLKILCPVRDIVSIIASFIKLNPERLRQQLSEEISCNRRFGLSYKPEIEVFCELITEPKSQLDTSLYSLHNLLLPENKDSVCVIEYDSLIKHPEKTFRKIYNFLGIPYFYHDFSNIDSFSVNDVAYNDSAVCKGLHTVRSSLSKSEYCVADVLPQYLISRYSELEFWRDRV